MVRSHEGESPISDINAVLPWYKLLGGDEKNPMRNESDLAEEKKNACRPIAIITAKKEIHENRVIRQKT